MPDQLISYKGIRKIIGDRMRESLDSAAQANHRLRVDMTSAIDFRLEFTRNEGVRPSFNDMIVKATAVALREFPLMNSELTGTDILLHEDINIGIAVATDNGLMVPVIRDCDQKSLNEIIFAAQELTEKARTRRLPLSDMQGGTFTVSNLGMFGLEGFTAIINPPQAAILAVGSIIKTPTVINDVVVVRPIMELSLSYDHRIVDGAPAARFLSRIRDLIENMNWCLQPQNI